MLPGAGDIALPQPHIYMAGLGVLSGSCPPLGCAISNTQTLTNQCVSAKYDLLVIHSPGKVKKTHNSH